MRPAPFPVPANPGGPNERGWKMSEIRLIIMDLDGTLLLDDGTVSPENRQALLDAQKRGVTIAVCSGRYCENVSVLLLDSGVYGPVVGSKVVDPEQGVVVAIVGTYIAVDGQRALVLPDKFVKLFNDMSGVNGVGLCLQG